MKVLIAGWLLGACVLLALSGTAKARKLQVAAAQTVVVSRVEVESIRKDVRNDIHPQLSIHDIIIPVQGISADQLRDTFTEPRGGGNRVHRAMDILAPLGTPVIAAVDGTIRKLFDSRAGGTTIYQFDVSEQTLYYYAHLDHYANGVREGLFVKQGTVIGYVGTTGNAGATPHLHFSIERLPSTKEWWKGDPVNPYPILRDAR